MKFKIIFGIVLPILIIMALAILGSSSVGFSAKTGFISHIALKDVYHDGQLRNTIKLGDITLKNENFLGRRYDLKPLTACLIDKEKVKQTVDAGNVFYSEGDYDVNSDKVIGYSSYSEERSVQISAGGKKIVNVYLTPAYRSYGYNQNYSEILEQYKGYDEIVIVEKKDRRAYNYYDSTNCYSLQDSDLADAEHIVLILQ